MEFCFPKVGKIYMFPDPLFRKLKYPFNLLKKFKNKMWPIFQLNCYFNQGQSKMLISFFPRKTDNLFNVKNWEQEHQLNAPNSCKLMLSNLYMY